MRFLMIALLTFFLSKVAFADYEKFILEDYDPTLVQVGDMYVPFDSVVDEGEANLKGLIQKNVRLWSGGVIRYEFSSSVSQSNRRLFLSSCRELGTYANIECVRRRSSDRDYIFITSNNRNVCGSSHLGRRGGRQTLVINCWRARTIQHELMHALGFTHEHNRYDRDEHITVQWKNLTPGLEHNFRIVSASNTRKILSYYDFDSILQYDSLSGSENGEFVLYRKDKGPIRGRIRQADTMSRGDHTIIWAVYGGMQP